MGNGYLLTGFDDAAALYGHVFDESRRDGGFHRFPAGADSDVNTLFAVWLKGRKKAPMEENPIFPGSARVRKISSSCDTSQRARDPINPCFETTASTRAMSLGPESSDTTRRGAFRVQASRGVSFEAMTPAAIPAMVLSIMKGNTLLVPVEMGEQGNLAAGLGHGPVGAVATQGDNACRIQITQPLCGRRAVVLGSLQGNIQETGLEGDFQILHGPGPDTEMVGHEENLLNAHGIQSQKDTPHDVDLFIIIKHGAEGHHAPNIFA